MPAVRTCKEARRLRIRRWKGQDSHSAHARDHPTPRTSRPRTRGSRVRIPRCNPLRPPWTFPLWVLRFLCRFPGRFFSISPPFSVPFWYFPRLLLALPQLTSLLGSPSSPAAAWTRVCLSSNSDLHLPSLIVCQNVPSPSPTPFLSEMFFEEPRSYLHMSPDLGSIL